ncbi:hypothetical protein [Catalinimonas niigatensis]|uniref:hypothetical protein n=1 Tax=Catalinimonas niigatensis TaxID=1397264 RepID=UPI002666D81C|nr:hypothetical protein [Catalinimonas niigatensis]WPP48293.1 hypothetical protein PZB72_16600 [Catalinimonas niigatensis]
MKKILIQKPILVLISMLIFSACEAIGVEGNLGLGVVGGIVVVIGLGWLALKVLGGVIKIGMVGIAVLVLIVIGLIAWAFISGMI